MTGRPVPAPTAPHRPPPRARPGQWVLLVLGTVLTVLGAGSLVLGLVLAGAAAAQDDGRWLTGGTERHQTVGRALTSPPAQLDTGGAPLPELPGVPTFREGGVELVLQGWRGLFAPKGTPPAAVAALERSVFEAFEDAAFAEQIRKLGLTPAPLGADAFAAFWAADREMVGKLVARLPKG